jgi:DNA-binding MarR family transcriptional regulator
MGVRAPDPHTPGAERQACAYVLGSDGLARWREPHAGAWLGFLQAHRQLTRELESRLESRFGLSLSGLELLGRLGAADGRRLRLSELAAVTGLTLSRISRIVDGFEERGLVERRACPEDGRATNAWLTEAGLALVREAQAAHVADVQRVFFDVLGTDELEVLAAAFATLAASPPAPRRTLAAGR